MSGVAGGDQDRAEMAGALALARRGLGLTATNPAVGCVLLREGRVVWKRPCPDAAACATLAADLLDRIRAARDSAG